MIAFCCYNNPNLMMLYTQRTNNNKINDLKIPIIADQNLQPNWGPFPLALHNRTHPEEQPTPNV